MRARQDGPPPGGTAPWARFDDLVAGTALHFPAFPEVLVARTPAEVAPVLAAVEEQTAAGRWAAGFVAYEAAAGLDPGLAVADPVPGLPLVWFGLSGPPRQPAVVAPGSRGPRDLGPWVPAWDQEAHRAAVSAVRERIAAGDTYQCNLTTRLSAPLPPGVAGDLGPLYADLALGQRGAHSALLDTGRFAVVSASPELFFEQRDGGPGPDTVLMRPMKGTAARGRTTAEDAAAVAGLLASEKERAENVMIVDLVRNDLARIAQVGSVTVPRLLSAERYGTVHQLTSDVTARLRPDAGLVDVFRALFPCGSVTGAPKAATMRLIRELEGAPRGVYCGAIGVLAPPGAPVRARFSVAIRTVLVDREAATAVYGAGGGITWSSDPAAEHAELHAKARVLHARPVGFSLLETMRADAGRVHALAAHLARLADSAEYFGFSFDPAAARALLAARLAGADARVRLRLARDGRLDVDLEPLPEPPAGPVRLAVDDVPIDSRECWPHHKTSRREPYTTRLARHPGADDVLLVNERGELTESCTANLAVRLDGGWVTPPLGGGCLPGVERGRLVAAGVVRERVLTPPDLLRAEALALVSSLRGWRPAELVRSPAPV